MYTRQALPCTFERIGQSLYRLRAWPVQRVLQLMDRIVEEGRNAVRGLLSPDAAPEDLHEVLSRIRGDCDLQHVDFRIVVIGRPKPLKPPVREAIYAIHREALINALRHSNATEIEIEAEYSLRRLQIAVRDNGCGIDPQVVRRQRDGHWGLTGMRELAESIGARLQIWSRHGAGTEIEVSVPGHVAFGSRPTEFFPIGSCQRPSVTLQEAG